MFAQIWGIAFVKLLREKVHKYVYAQNPALWCMKEDVTLAESHSFADFAWLN
jgi:hypothetical protein